MLKAKNIADSEMMFFMRDFVFYNKNSQIFNDSYCFEELRSNYQKDNFSLAFSFLFIYPEALI